MVLLLDNYDSFTYNLYDYIKQLGIDCFVIRNDQYSVKEIQRMEFSSIVISPGPGIPSNSGVCMDLIEKYHNKLPILGICLGFQAIGEFFGAELVKAKIPMHGKTSSLEILNKGRLFKDLANEIEVMRYHSLILQNLPEELQLLCKTQLNEPMAFEHESLPLAGVQFHPESILTKDGITILKNWFNSLN